MRHYDTAIIGSGYFSAGFALSHPDSIVIERTHLCDGRFYARLNGFTLPENAKNTQKTALAAELRAHFRSLGMERGGLFHVCASESALCDFLRKKGEQTHMPEFLLNTTCIGVEKQAENGVFRLTLCHNGGLETITAAHVIDTRTHAPKNTLNVLCMRTADGLSAPTECAPFDLAVFAGTGMRVSFEPAFYPEQFVLRFAWQNAKNINEAKCELYRAWKKCVPKDRAKMIQTAYRMYGEAPSGARALTRDEAGVLHVCEAALGSVYEAFDCGAGDVYGNGGENQC